MPNHVTTILTAHPHDVIEALLNEKREVDFEKVLPMPEDVYRGGLGAEEEAKYPGDKNWYNWGVNHWGTKWNAYSTVLLSHNTVSFETAWAHPFPVIAELANRFPSAVLEVKYADEDLGHNLGQYTIKDGGITHTLECDEGTDEANDFAAQVKYGRSYAQLRAEWDE